MKHTAQILLLTLAALLGMFEDQASAQAPKVGAYYEDAVDIGFKVKMPKDWEFTPPQPKEPYIVGKYTPALNRYIYLSPTNPLWLEAFVIKFDRRPKPDQAEQETPEEDETDAKADENLTTEARHERQVTKWLDDHMRGSDFQVKTQKETKVKKVPATEFLYIAQDNGDAFHVYAMAYQLSPELDVAIIFNGPEEKKKWRKYEKSIKQMAKSFQPIEVEEIKHKKAKGNESSLRSLKRAALEMEVAKSQDWKLYETENYFVVSNNDDRQFMKEILDRLEAIRGVYEETYPFEEAARLKVAAQKRLREEQREKGESEEDEQDVDELGRKKTTSAYSSRQKSRCSVVRVCKNNIQYREYGGPGGSAGYWNNRDEELVIYDDQSGGGRRNTWAVLNHEAFHQYIFYLYGSISPHSWYNEGTGDFFGGFQYKHKKFIRKPFAWRVDTIRTAIKADDYVPLEKLVRFTQREYYGNNDFDTSAGQNYAQGWSLIWFLRTGKGKASKWNNDWDKILDIYFETLASSEDLDQAVTTAFEGVDWQAMEESWKKYTLQ